jgi:enoyl-[acyl-carrier protein] reductase I
MRYFYVLNVNCNNYRLLQRKTFSSAPTEKQPMSNPKLALVMGVANQRSIAWACVESFLQKNHDCIITYHIPSTEVTSSIKYKSKIEKLIEPYTQTPSDMRNGSRIIGYLPCNVETDLPDLFKERIPILLEGRKIDAVVHSIAYAPEMDKPLLQTSGAAYLTAQHISAYSLIQTIRECVANDVLSKSSAVTTLSYLGAIRAVPGYGCMGPAKAALESVVRGLAIEVGPGNIRVNAVSAGPIKTVSARGIPNFGSIQQHVLENAPLRRNVSIEEVAETVTWLSSVATGITGQTIYVDAGYSVTVPIQP